MPKHVVILEEMPLTPNGKVDAEMFPKPGAKVTPTIGFTAPETAREQELASIVANVLKVSRVSATQNFFDMGVDSLRAIEIAMQAYDMGIQLKPTALFEHRTLRALAKASESLAPEEVLDIDEDEDLLDLDEFDIGNIAKVLK